MRDKDVRSPSRSCDEPGRRRFCWLGNLQGAGAFAAKQACCSRGSSNVSGAPRLWDGLTWPAQWWGPALLAPGDVIQQQTRIAWGAAHHPSKMSGEWQRDGETRRAGE